MTTAARFRIVGENIHCTRVFKVGGKNVEEVSPGSFAIRYGEGRGQRLLPVPGVFTESGAWQDGKVKHCAVAVWQGIHGAGSDRDAGRDYIASLAARQEKAGADFLDINVDELSTDLEERVAAMKWAVGVMQAAVKIPVSVDSSNLRILRAGLEAADSARGRPMINSVSLERAEAIGLAKEFKAVVIASAAGERGLPGSLDERMANLDRLMTMLKAAGLGPDEIFVDPLVYPISTDPANGVQFLEAVASVRKEYGAAIHIAAGLSNVSFGMPKRSLINIVFTHLAVEAGADGGIVDPMQINREALASVDAASREYELARNLLLGRDEFGMEFISAFRSGDM
ncbi:MAG: hypothetical protein FJ224_02670 [Lentisphaerae bacterium]|nr:hypothetical protein [Lentisphaerota bacterium]